MLQVFIFWFASNYCDTLKITIFFPLFQKALLVWVSWMHLRFPVQRQVCRQSFGLQEMQKSHRECHHDAIQANFASHVLRTFWKLRILVPTEISVFTQDLEDLSSYLLNHVNILNSLHAICYIFYQVYEETYVKMLPFLNVIWSCILFYIIFIVLFPCVKY